MWRRQLGLVGHQPCTTINSESYARYNLYVCLAMYDDNVIGCTGGWVCPVSSLCYVALADGWCAGPFSQKQTPFSYILWQFYHSEAITSFN
jgi:hypothetical protein